ncbi:MAG: threonine synthase [Rhodothermaceae bacterium]|nr:MAG: threonine synthase [Rhodothermaceae bacterium]
MNLHPAYRSTRGGAVSVSFEDALLEGLAPDGGLFVPEAIPALPLSWRSAGSFPEMALAVLARWIGHEVAQDVLEPLLADALSFPVPLVPLRGGDWDGVYVLELFHGPTLSFKDFGARTMARLMGHFLAGRQETVTILVATSGDTGSAVADGFAGQDHIRVVLLYPSGQVSPTQERQLIVARPGVQALAVRGTFDDCQRMVKEAFVHEAAAQRHLSSANSINVGRLLPQMLYYVWAVRAGGFDRVHFCVPSGNLGNLTGGVLAALGGLPVGRFIAAHNANDFFPRVLAGEEETYRASVRTLSNAMDVGVPSNYERLRALLPVEELRRRIWGTSVSDDETLAAIRRVYAETGYLADPHTAVGLEAARRYRRATGDPTPIIVLSTAHPAKFPEVLCEALGFEAKVPEQLARLRGADTSVLPIEASTDELMAYLLAHDAARA